MEIETGIKKKKPMHLEKLSPIFPKFFVLFYLLKKKKNKIIIFVLNLKTTIKLAENS